MIHSIWHKHIQVPKISAYMTTCSYETNYIINENFSLSSPKKSIKKKNRILSPKWSTVCKTNKTMT